MSSHKTCQDIVKIHFMDLVTVGKMDGINMQYKIHEHTIEEYASIRSEMIERIQILNNQSISSISACIAAWVITATLFVTSFSDKAFLVQSNHYLLCIMLSASAFLPTLFLLPASIKSGENLAQITSISCYIRVFFEHAETNKLFSWESANNSLSSINIRRRHEKIQTFYNSEYFVLSVISLLINAIVVISMFYRMYENNMPIYKTVIFFCSALWVIEVFLTIWIYKFSSVYINMEKMSIKCIYGFVLYGLKTQKIEVLNTTDMPLNEQAKGIAESILQEGHNDYDLLQNILRYQRS